MKWLAVVGVFVLGACGEASPATSRATATVPPTTTETSTTTAVTTTTVPPSNPAPTTLAPAPTPDELGSEDTPPRIVIEGSDGLVEVRAISWGGTEPYDDEFSQSYHADGVVPDPLPSAGTADGPIRFRFSTDGWQFNAYMAHPDGTSGGPAVVTAVAADLWEIEPAGRAGVAVVHLSGRRPGVEFGLQGFDLQFQVESLVDGPEPPPFFEFQGAYGDGLPNATVLEVAVVAGHLADDRDPSAVVTVTAGDGQQLEIVLGDHQDGPDPEGNGTIGLYAPPPDPAVLASFGPPPYVYDVALTINRTIHRATIRYPDDLDPDTSHYAFTFTPPLPADPDRRRRRRERVAVGDSPQLQRNERQSTRVWVSVNEPWASSRSGVSEPGQLAWNATPIVPRPVWVPMTGPMSPTTISPS